MTPPAKRHEEDFDWDEEIGAFAERNVLPDRKEIDLEISERRVKIHLCDNLSKKRLHPLLKKFLLSLCSWLFGVEIKQEVVNADPDETTDSNSGSR